MFSSLTFSLVLGTVVSLSFYFGMTWCPGRNVVNSYTPSKAAWWQLTNDELESPHPFSSQGPLKNAAPASETPARSLPPWLHGPIGPSKNVSKDVIHHVRSIQERGSAPTHVDQHDRLMIPALDLAKSIVQQNFFTTSWLCIIILNEAYIGLFHNWMCGLRKFRATEVSLHDSVCCSLCKTEILCGWSRCSTILYL
jgi:hypothetical protein